MEGSLATTLSAFTTALSGIADDVTPIIVTIAASFVGIVAVVIGIRWLLKAAKLVK